MTGIGQLSWGNLPLLGIKENNTARQHFPMGADSVHFSGRGIEIGGSGSTISTKIINDRPINEKINNYAETLLQTINNGKPLKAGQKITLVADSEYLPLVNKIVEMAYKDFNSGWISVEIKEPEFETLKEKYDISEEEGFQSSRLFNKKLEDQGAASLNLSDVEDSKFHYDKAGLTSTEIKNLVKSIQPITFPEEIKELMNVDPKEIFTERLKSFEKGQALVISAPRELKSIALKLAEAAMRDYGSKKVSLTLNEQTEFDLSTLLYRYGTDEALAYIPEKMIVDGVKEEITNHAFEFRIYDQSVVQPDDIDAKKVASRETAIEKIVGPYIGERFNNCPYLVFYRPTMASAKQAGYSPDIEGFKEAIKDSQLFNHEADFVAHARKLESVRDALTDKVKEGYQMLHYEASDPVNGKKTTDIRVKVTPKSRFIAGGYETTTGQYVYPNSTTLEAFTVPDHRGVNGYFTSPKPITLSGKIVKGAYFEFKDGKITKVDAQENLDILKEWIKGDGNERRLAGEIAVVTAVPEALSKKFFNNGMVDENSGPHAEIGGTRFTMLGIEGAPELAKDPEKLALYLKELGVDQTSLPSPDLTLADARYVTITMEKLDNPSDSILIAQDNEWKIG